MLRLMAALAVPCCWAPDEGLGPSWAQGCSCWQCWLSSSLTVHCPHALGAGVAGVGNAGVQRWVLPPCMQACVLAKGEGSSVCL